MICTIRSLENKLFKLTQNTIGRTAMLFLRVGMVLGTVSQTYAHAREDHPTSQSTILVLHPLDIMSAIEHSKTLSNGLFDTTVA